MHVVILGAGQVGGTLVELLNDGSNSLSVVEENLQLLNTLAERVDGLLITHGNAALPSTLRRANAGAADMIIAVTGNDQTNIVASQVAKSIFGTRKVIARIRAQEYQDEQDYVNGYLTLSRIINPEEEVTKQIQQLLHHQNALQILGFVNNLVTCFSFYAVVGTTPAGLTLGELYKYTPLHNVRFLAAYRGYESLSKKTDKIQPGDELFVIAPTDSVDEMLTQCTGITRPVKKVCIAGGGHIGTALAKSIQDTHSVSIIEFAGKAAEQASLQLKDGIVHIGDATDETKLQECEVSDTDVFCSVTNNDEINVMSCLLAKQQGAKRTVALLSKDSYLRLLHGTTIDAGISPQRSTVSSILTHVREQNVKSAYRLRIGNAEILETQIAGKKGDNQVTDRELDSIKLPPEAQIAAVVRDKTILDLETNPVLAEGDHVVIFVEHSGFVPAALKPFRASQFFFL